MNADTDDNLKSQWQKLHREACERGEETYIDPISGFPVYTEIAHMKRGSCCRSGCRHCPFGFIKVLQDS